MKFTKDNNSNNRRKLIYWAAGMLSTLVFWRISKKEEKKIEPERVKMLTESGELVEIDPRFLAGKGQKIKPEEIHTWVKNRK